MFAKDVKGNMFPTLVEPQYYRSHISVDFIEGLPPSRSKIMLNHMRSHVNLPRPKYGIQAPLRDHIQLHY